MTDEITDAELRVFTNPLVGYLMKDDCPKPQVLPRRLLCPKCEGQMQAVGSEVECPRCDR